MHTQGYKMEAQRQSKLIYSLEKEREKYAVEASEAAAKYMQVCIVCVGGVCVCSRAGMRRECLYGRNA